MKRIIYILLILSAALNAYHSKGQSCPATPTYKNQSGTFDLSSGRSIVLNSGGSFQITVQNTFYSDASICVTNPLTGATFTVTLTDLTAGTYTLSVVNSNGTTVAVKTLAHAGGTASQKVTLNSQLTAGVYYIKLSSAGAVVSTTSITAQ